MIALSLNTYFGFGHGSYSVDTHVKSCLSVICGKTKLQINMINGILPHTCIRAKFVKVTKLRNLTCDEVVGM